MLIKYSGGIFSDFLEERRAKAEIWVEDQQVFAETSKGKTFCFDFLDTRVELGGASGNMIFLRSKDGQNTLFCEENGFQEELLQSSFASVLQPLLDKKRRSKTQLQVLGVAVLAMFGVFLWGSFLLLQNLGGYVLGLIPPNIDEKFGELAYETMDHGGPEVQHDAIVQPVQEVVDILERAVQDHTGQAWTFKVHVIDADIQNAYALPGGYIIVYTGLLREMEQPEQLAGVLAHEMAHVTERHSVQRLIELVGLAFIIDGLLGDVEGMVALGAEILSYSTINAYSRDAETEADLKGLEFLEQAEIDPRGLIAFFTMLDQEQDGLTVVLPEWMSTHPDYQVRIQSIEKKINKKRENQDLTEKIAWKSLKDNLD